jgi:hypothetical protein
LFSVALRARVCEGLAADYGAFRRLFSAEGAGTWIAFVAAMMRSRKSAIAAFSGLPQWLAPSRRFSYRDSSSTAFCPTICTRRCGGWDGHGCSSWRCCAARCSRQGCPSPLARGARGDVGSFRGGVLGGQSGRTGRSGGSRRRQPPAGAWGSMRARPCSARPWGPFTAGWFYTTGEGCRARPARRRLVLRELA